MAIKYANHPIAVQSYRAKTDLPAYVFVLDDTGTDGEDVVKLPASLNDVAIGITMHSAKAGEQVDVLVLGIGLLRVDGNATPIVPRTKIIVHGADGFGQAAAASTTNNVAAMALSSATADGTVIPVVLTPNGGTATIA